LHLLDGYFIRYGVISQIDFLRWDIFFDLTVPKYHNYVGEGAIHHNSGKTTAGAVEAAWWSTNTHPYQDTPKKCKGLCVENTWSLIGDPMWKKLAEDKGLKTAEKKTAPPILAKRHIESVAWTSKQLSIPSRLTLKNGSTIDFKSGDAGRTAFEGAEYDWVWIDEELADSLVFTEIQRGLVDRGGHLWWTATPLARSRAMLDLHEEANDIGALRKVFEAQLSIFDNPYLDDDARREFIASIPEEYIQTRVYGDFLILEGLVYGEWNRREHEISRQDFKDMNQKHPRVIVIDPGYADPCAVGWFMLLPGERRRAIMYRESYKKRQTVKDTVRMIARESAGEQIVACIIDRASLKKDQSGADSIYQQYQNAFKEFGVKNGLTGNTLRIDLASTDISAGIYTVKEFLAYDDYGIPFFRAVDDLKDLKRELGRYRWGEASDKKGVPDKPVDRDNHLLDVVRYFLSNLPAYRTVRSATMSQSERIFEEAQRIMAPDRGDDSISVGG
jgi:hypothetical protein